MTGFVDFGIAKKLGVLFAAGVVCAAATGAVGLWAQRELTEQAKVVGTLEKANGLLNHLDTREAELKVNGYRAALEADLSDVVEDMPDDLASVTETLAEIDALNLTDDLRREIDIVRPDVLAFNDFIETFVADATKDQTAVIAREGEIAERNDVVDDKLEVLHEKINAAVAAAHASMDDTVGTARLLTAVTVGLGVVLFLAIVTPVGRSIVGSARRVRTVLEALAAGDLTQQVGHVGKDEIGQMASALDTAILAMRRSITAVSTSSDGLATASRQLLQISDEISGATATTSSQMNDASTSSAQVSRHVSTVAAGAEEMGVSIQEIARNAASAAGVATGAVREAASANDKVTRLGASSAEIGNVLKLITSIAEQTNLLALNATIEAARAGESGKGFAVVANEVKELAQETAKATDDIHQRVSAIQADTEAVADAIRRMATVVQEINDYQTTIASAVEQQSATTAEMSRSVQEAATGAESIASNITGVAQATVAATQGVTDAQTAAADLSTMSQELRQLVSQFRI